jgi:hypothetical protein
VFFAGGGGSLLLIQPDSIVAAISKLPIILIFIIASSATRSLIDEAIVGLSPALRQRPGAQAHVVACPTNTP